MTTYFASHLLTGDHASRPAATAVPEGSLYSCTDHDLVYQSDGATWSTWATVGGASGPAIPVPWALIPVTGIVPQGAATSLGAANRGILMPVDVPVDCTIDGVRYRVGTAAGNISVALYSSALSRLATSGDVACPASGGATTSFTAPYAATAGRYYVGLSASSNSATFTLSQGNTIFGPFGGIYQETAHPLPSTFTSAGGARAIALAGIISGGLSS